MYNLAKSFIGKVFMYTNPLLQKQKPEAKENKNFENQSLIDFFDLLFKIDQRLKNTETKGADL
ncbi:MAG: hypothetical protein V1698_03245 [bacterium]